jgi:hypothetical protein
VNILNKKSQTADEGCSSGEVGWRGLTNPNHKNPA